MDNIRFKTRMLGGYIVRVRCIKRIKKESSKGVDAYADKSRYKMPSQAILEKGFLAGKRLHPFTLPKYTAPPLIYLLTLDLGVKLFFTFDQDIR